MMFLLQANTTSLINRRDLQLIAPELILTACACVALVMEVVLPYRKSKLTAYFSLCRYRTRCRFTRVQLWYSARIAARWLLRHGADRWFRPPL